MIFQHDNHTAAAIVQRSKRSQSKQAYIAYKNCQNGKFCSKLANAFFTSKLSSIVIVQKLHRSQKACNLFFTAIAKTQRGSLVQILWF